LLTISFFVYLYSVMSLSIYMLLVSFTDTPTTEIYTLSLHDALPISEVIKQKPTVRWLFLTLTVKNVYDGEELNKSLSDMAQGFNRMMKYKKINKNLVGFMRATEVTVNNIDNSYNQHMH